MSHNSLQAPALHALYVLLLIYFSSTKFPEMHELQAVIYFFFWLPKCYWGNRLHTYTNSESRWSSSRAVSMQKGLFFYNVVCLWPGSEHDSRIFRKSALYAQMQAGAYDGHLLGYSAFPLCTF